LSLEKVKREMQFRGQTLRGVKKNPSGLGATDALVARPKISEVLQKRRRTERCGKGVPFRDKLGKGKVENKEMIE